MQRTTWTLTVIVALAVLAMPVAASGPLGIYAVVERVVFEPSEAAPERVRVYGAFAFFDGDSPRSSETNTTAPVRGYVYFKLPAGGHELVRNEWSDLASVAGTGQGVAFARYGYIGLFEGLRTDASFESGVPYVLEPDGPNGISFASSNLSVRPVSATPANPAAYVSSGFGVVRLGANHEPIVGRLRALVEDAR